jgi:hypothetical protein
VSSETIDAGLDARIARLEEAVAQAERQAQRAQDRGDVENLFSTYMYLHNAFRDEEIIPLWVKEGTPGIHAQYSNLGVYTTWESVTEYHRGRPTPVGSQHRRHPHRSQRQDVFVRRARRAAGRVVVHDRRHHGAHPARGCRAR